MILIGLLILKKLKKLILIIANGSILHIPPFSYISFYKLFLLDFDYSDTY